MKRAVFSEMIRKLGMVISEPFLTGITTLSLPGIVRLWAYHLSAKFRYSLFFPCSIVTARSQKVSDFLVILLIFSLLPFWQQHAISNAFPRRRYPRAPCGEMKMCFKFQSRLHNKLCHSSLRRLSSRNKLWNPVCDVDRSKTYRVAVYVRIANWPPGYLGFRANSSASSFWSLKTELYRQEWKSRRRALHDQSRET